MDNKIRLGYRVKNIRSGKIGIVINIFDNGGIAVLEKVSPLVINTHDSISTLKIIDEGLNNIFTKSKVLYTIYK